jgi:hypothetical protein
VSIYWESSEDLDLGTVVGELAGYASVCWDPKPSGVFDSEDASDAVDSALGWINRHYTSREEYAALKAQIDRLAVFIMDEVPGEPSQSQGAVDTAIRIIKEYTS